MGSLQKAAIIANIRNTINTLKMEYNTDFKIALYTTMGKIVCDVEPPAKKSSFVNFDDDPAKLVVDISAIFDGTEAFETHLINARDVVVYNNSNEEIMKIEQMILFADDILGFALVKKGRQLVT